VDEAVAVVRLVILVLTSLVRTNNKINCASEIVISLGGTFSKFKDMAESRGSLLAKSVQKHAGRAKEKVSDTFPS
jgi:hypothetical protein